jgi:hypothetical protein
MPKDCALMNRMIVLMTFFLYPTYYFFNFDLSSRNRINTRVLFNYKTENHG